MFNRQTFLAECQAAVQQADPVPLVKEIMTRAIANPEQVSAEFADETRDVLPIIFSDELTILHVSTVPHLVSPIHNHLAWVVIGIYAGDEINYFYRRNGDEAELSEQITLTAGDVYVMPPDAIHAIENPLPSRNGALHVYGSNLQTKPGRSFWNPETGKEQPYDFEQVVTFTRINQPD